MTSLRAAFSLPFALALTFAAAVSAALALPAAAQADQIDDARFLKACVQARLPGGTAVAELSCLGLISLACASQLDPKDEAGETACLTRERDAWQGLLDDWWPDLLAAAVALDARDDRNSASADALRQAQRAWQSFAKAECGYAYALWGRSTYRDVAQADCEMRTLGRRAIQLRAQIGLEPK